MSFQQRDRHFTPVGSCPTNSHSPKKEFHNTKRLGIVRRSKSQWASPFHMVPKASGDYHRHLNDVTTPDRYPILHIQDFTSNLAGCRNFSKINLVRGYHHVPVRPKDIPKTAIITTFSLFQFLWMPFGLKNVTQAFQRLMDVVLQVLEFI